MENNGIAYKMEGSVFIPRVDLSDRQINPGKYGWKRVQWLMHNHPVIFTVLKMKSNYGRMNADFNEKAMQYERELVKKLAEERKAEMPDKNTHPVEWAVWMDALKVKAEEIVTEEMVHVSPTLPPA